MCVPRLMCHVPLTNPPSIHLQVQLLGHPAQHQLHLPAAEGPGQVHEGLDGRLLVSNWVAAVVVVLGTCDCERLFAVAASFELLSAEVGAGQSRCPTARSATCLYVLRPRPSVCCLRRMVGVDALCFPTAAATRASAVTPSAPTNTKCRMLSDVKRAHYYYDFCYYYSDEYN